MNEKDFDNETKELIDSFTAESNDLLDDIEPKLHSLEKEDAEELINTVFRAFHSIKGTAGYLNFKNITSITHTAETLLDIYRKENVRPTQVEIDVLFMTCDIMRKLILNIEQKQSDDVHCDEVTIITESIQRLIGSYKKESGGKTAPEKNKEKKIETDDIVTNEIIEKFISESNALTENAEETFLKLEKDPENIELIGNVFRDIHTIKGNAGFIGAERIEKECMEIENFLDKIRSKEKKITNNIISYLLGKIDIVENLVNSLQYNKNKENIENYKPLGEILIDMGVISDEALNKTLEIQQSKIGELLIDRGIVSEEAVKTALEKQNKSVESGSDSSAILKKSDVRVSTLKLDKLFDLAGEIVTAQALVVNCPELDGMDIPKFEKAANYLTKITREIQEIAMTIRMIPLEGIFSKSIRLVRDLSRKAGKNIDLKISGEETEMDRKIIEELSDPLVHIIRNSIDHGIEADEEREKKGKTDKALIRLNARYEGNEIWISISDNGRGLNRNKIISKAKEKGIITSNPDELKDEDVWQFIFLPGFSTADKITDISGRGVGMDVVKKNIEKVKGKIAVHSNPDFGTEITLKIPLTVAILDVITVKVSENIYSIPTVDILEFLQPKNDLITRLNAGKEIIKIRNEVIPIVKLNEFYKISNAEKKYTEGVMVVVEREKKKAALFIDSIMGSQQVVIKPLNESFRESRGISGCSILGNGDLSLIIDTGRLIEETFE